MSPIMPVPLVAYFTAERVADTGLLASCFAADAVVQDEGRTMVGLDAIRRWKRETKAKYQYSVEPLSASQVADTVTVQARLTGAFPGSPIELSYRFVVAGDKIASLEIG
jgi:hypothetical protein